MGLSQSRTKALASEHNHAAELDEGDVIDKLTEAQLDEFREAFAAFDRDGGGSIDATELKQLMASVGQVPSDEELHEMIRIADADGSGSVDFCEFVTLMAHKMADPKSENHVKAAFSLFDFSGDGFIQAEEMRRVLMNVGEPVTIEDVNGLIKEVDSNGDGAVNYDEFAKVVLSEKPVPFGRVDGAGPPAVAAAADEKKRRRRFFGRG